MHIELLLLQNILYPVTHHERVPFQWEFVLKTLFKSNCICARCERYFIKHYSEGSSPCISNNEIYLQRHKLARKNIDLYFLQLMSLPVLVFINATKGNNPRHLCVVFNKTHPLILKNKAFSTLIDAPKP